MNNMDMMVRSLKCLSCTAVAGALYVVGLSAQAPPGRVFEYKVAAEAGAAMLMGPGEDMERIVKGAPFSAQATTTTTQVLGDGNRIVQTTEMTLARDGEGRTRREMSVDKLGPWSTDSTGRMTFIRDPIALVSYVLSPDGQHATKSSLRVPSPDDEHMIALKREHEREGGNNAKVEAEVRTRVGVSVKTDAIHSETRDVIYAGQAGPGGPPPEFHAMILGDSGEGQAQKESLGEQTIEGVRAQGTRVTRTIPAGRIGNERPIEIVSESWYSPDLQMVVQSKRSDPRMGETIYRLTNVALAEPDATLFQVPAGMTLQSEKETFRVDMRSRTKTPDDQPEQPE
jgi:hypothetical protein